MGNAVMKALRFADTQGLCFEDWNRSHMSCSPCFVVDLLILVNRVQALKRSNIGSAVL